MYLRQPKLVVLSLCIPGILANFLGPRFPAPTDLSSDKSLVAARWDNFVSTLEESMNGTKHGDGNSDLISELGLANITFSLDIFSIHDPKTSEAMQFHYTSAEIANATSGTHSVDADSIYRIASLTKLFSVFAGLLEFDNKEWDRPITDFIPALADYARKNSGKDDPATTIQWNKVTLAALGAQIAGVPRGGIPFDADTLSIWLLEQAAGTAEKENDPVLMGLPALNISDPTIVPLCALSGDHMCDADGYAQGESSHAPTFLPWASPAYSNNGFMLFGIALANITGKSLEEVYHSSIFEPLGMNSSSTIVPSGKNLLRSVIPGDLSTAGFKGDWGISISSGGIFSTIKDLAKFGIGILNSTLLSDDQTRKWMKPVSHTASLEHSVRRPWEIARYTHPKSGVVTDLYTKSGDSGLFSSFLILLPDYGVGFTILTAGTSTMRTDAAALIADLMTESILPALEAQAALETANKFAGTYTSTIDGLNSSLILFLNNTSSGTPDLAVSSWISNGTDMLLVAPKFIGKAPLRLLPSITESGSGQLAFRLTTIPVSTARTRSFGPFLAQYAKNMDWLTVDAGTYGGVGFSLFVFDVEDGDAVTVTPAVTRAKLRRVSM
ncbi:hypothetical protein G7046_g2222 [Stylonectria norvegica]|nr:hypothetical protein G7046_g2222 [Stylonectria norvegica]